MKRFAPVLAFLLLTACIVTVPPVVAPPFEPPVVTPPVTPPVEPPAPEPEPEPWRDLNLRVFNQSRQPIAGATVSIPNEQRSTDGNGFANFGVQGSKVVTVSADGCEGQKRDVPPGDHEFTLTCKLPEPVVPPPPPDPAPLPVPVPPTPLTKFPGCAPALNTGKIAAECLEAVSLHRRPLDYAACQKGDGVACHRYVRAVARALADHVPTDGTWGWGLLSKPSGQQACTMERCGRNVADGYGEDMVTYLPKGNPVNLWTGLDIIIGAGAAGARYGGGELPPAVGGRPDNLWAPVP